MKMGSNVCRTIRKYEGTKSQKILEMIAEKRRKEIEVKIPSLAKDKELVELRKAWAKAEENAKKAKELFHKKCTKLNITYNDYQDEYRPVLMCECDRPVMMMLQNAQDLYSLGKHKEANEIWDGIIKEFKLAGMKPDDRK